MKLPRKHVNEFEPRYVAFVDIIGFRNLIHRMASEPALFQTVRDALITIDLQARKFREYRDQLEGRHTEMTDRKAVLLLAPTRVEMTGFSDCYLLSDKAPAWRVIAAVQALGSRLLSKGILCRGAAVHGLAYHHQRVVFGPAVVAAYELERDVAKYPRVVVADSVREACWRYHEGLCKGRLFQRDVDGCWFINMFEPPLSHWNALVSGDNQGDRVAFLEQVRGRLTAQIESSKSELAHASKVRWAVNYFNVAATQLGAPTIETDVAASGSA